MSFEVECPWCGADLERDIPTKQCPDIGPWYESGWPMKCFYCKCSFIIAWDSAGILVTFQ